MKQCLLFTLLVCTTQVALSQLSDFVVLKKRNNRTVKTYYPGAFISAVTYNNFNISGFIKDIRHDSIIVMQQERRLMPGDFGTELGTVTYLLAVDYHQIKRFNYANQDYFGRKSGFAEVTLPRLMIYGGLGYLVLELVNTAYRGESLNANNKLPSLGIAAGVAATGLLIRYFQNKSDKAGGKYKVIYVKNTR
jgi:hypothetical protein